jgi:transcriptional regulator with XRE-family HTH domain
MKHSVDVHVGKRVRQRRSLLGMTMQQLGEKVGIGHQQLQKYETGANRISASRMWNIAAAMEVPVSFFFEGLEGQAPDTGEAGADIHTDKKALDLVRAYYAIPENQRRKLFNLALVLGEARQIARGEVRARAAGRALRRAITNLKMLQDNR